MIKEIKKILKIYVFNKKIKVNKNEKKCYILMSADYGNVGDLAINYAQRKFIQENIKDYKIIEIPLQDIYSMYLSMKKNLNEKDIFTVIGGGNSGDIYVDFEERRRFIYSKFKSNKIISFPQSIIFSNTEYGKKQLNLSKVAYSSNKNLCIFARESKSFEIYQKNFKDNNIFLVPDIVLSLKEKRNFDRKNITICLRKDKEQNLKEENKKELLKEIEKKYGKLTYKDTHLGDVKVSIELREKILKEYFDEFSRAKVIITDRLHGMIFSVITGTPCIVLNNNNHKIEYTYKNWLKDVNLISFLDTFDKNRILEELEKLYNLKEINTFSFDDKYEQLKKALKEEI